MPNVQVSIYLTDGDFKKYLRNKYILNTVARTALKKELEVIGNGQDREIFEEP